MGGQPLKKIPYRGLPPIFWVELGPHRRPSGASRGISRADGNQPCISGLGRDFAKRISCKAGGAKLAFVDKQP